MTRRLVLFRHAKSDWSNPLLPDEERPLAERGLRDAPRMGAWLRARGVVPDKALVSPAARAQQTWEMARTRLGADVPAETVEMLYAFATPRPLLEAARRFGEDARTLMLVGHNEAMHELAVALAKTGEEAALKRLRKKFPTAAVAVIDLPIAEWFELSDLTPGHLVHYVRPKDLR